MRPLVLPVTEGASFLSSIRGWYVGVGPKFILCPRSLPDPHGPRLALFFSNSMINDP